MPPYLGWVPSPLPCAFRTVDFIPHPFEMHKAVIFPLLQLPPAGFSSLCFAGDRSSRKQEVAEGIAEARQVCEEIQCHLHTFVWGQQREGFAEVLVLPPGAVLRGIHLTKGVASLSFRNGWWHALPFIGWVFFVLGLGVWCSSRPSRIVWNRHITSAWARTPPESERKQFTTRS